jgi:RimJ/RimL family protein N-acetyltransferase
MVNGSPESFAQLKKRHEERPGNTYDDAEPETGRAELTIYIGDPKYRGGGYGTDAMRVLCRYGFDEMRLHGISLWVVGLLEGELAG